MKRTFLLIFSCLLLLETKDIFSQYSDPYTYLQPSNATIKDNEVIDIFGRAGLSGDTTLWSAELLVSLEGDPRFDPKAIIFPAVFNLQIGIRQHEYKATVGNLPIGNYSFCYKYVYNNGPGYFGGAVGNDPAMFYPGSLKVVSSSTSVDGLYKLPITFVLFQNYPNPFNPSTTIKFSVPASLNPSKGGTFVSLKVYDVLGRKVATLVNEEKAPGNYEVKFDPAKSGQAGTNLASGVYFYTLITNGFFQSKKMLLMK